MPPIARRTRSLPALAALAALATVASAPAAASGAASGTYATYAAAASDGAAVRRGAAIYARSCALCHTPTRVSTIGPDLSGVARRRTLPGLRRHLATAVPGPLRPDEVRALVAYLARRSERLR